LKAWLANFWNPLVSWELVRLGRSPHLRWLRIGLAGTMLVGLLLAYLRSAPSSALASLHGVDVSPSESQKFGESFLIAFLVVQLIAVVLLTPVIVAGGMCEEKERGRLDFLRATALTPAEIVLGMYWARVLHILGVVAVGVPILVLSRFFGAVDELMILAGVVIAGFTVLSLGAYVQLQAVRRSTLREVLVVTYANLSWLTVLGFSCGCMPVLSAASPFSALLYTLYNRTAYASTYFVFHLVGYAIVHTVLTFLWLRRAVREIENPTIEMPKPIEGEMRAYPLELRAITREDMDFPGGERGFFVPMLEDDTNPYLWKERYFSARFSFNVHGAVWGCVVSLILSTLFIIGMLLFISVLENIDRNSKNPTSPIMLLVRLVVTCGAMFVILVTGVRTAMSLVREREKQTLEGLLTIPEDRANILIAKWFNTLRSQFPLLIAALLLEFLGFVSASVSIFGTVMVILHLIAGVLFANTLGLWLSWRCRSGTVAVVWWLSLLMLISIAPVILQSVAAALQLDHLASLLRFASPPVGLWSAHFPIQRESGPAIFWGYIPPMLELSLAYGLWTWTRLGFEREGK
jgi:ABC-type transport system involved in multi-copper enzyme maturation permease subunit